MILLEILHKEKAIRATDLETHWTTYIAAREDEFLFDDPYQGIEGMITITAGKSRTAKRILAAFPKC